MTTHRSHAVVLGASMAGLVHAAALAERFDRVTLVDRDVLPDQPDRRRGVPQDRHIHLLVPGGVVRLEQLLPGVTEDFAARGAHIIAAPEWRFYMGGDRLNLTDALRVVGATRPLIESVVRDRVRALSGVEFVDGWSARNLTTTDDRTRVTGVRLRSEAVTDETRTLSADLVVDTTGRGSPSPRWLADLGYRPPNEDRLMVGVHYTTRLFRRTDGDLGGCRNVVVDIPPGSRRGGVALAIEDGRWLVTLMGMLGERPPTDITGFTDYAGSLWVNDLHEIVRDAEPVSDAFTMAFPAFSWHRYDRLRRLPEGYAVSGDAVCSFDPRFGQGMTVAITEAIELGRVVDRHGNQQVGKRLLAAARPVVRDAWDLATGSDLANPDVDGPRPLPWRLTQTYLQRLLPVAHHDPEVAAAVIRTIGMLDRPQRLMHPRTLRRVLAGGRVRRERDEVPTPPAGDAVAGGPEGVGAER
ncbi:hypothetical protein [Haloactinopolyspora sp.]|uniref:FAD-dependent oxidoreductase n=1 Tax=Haloactinopolyspora sp. TaxID=1966353 RepID=UPI00260D5D91|nr:hypothetical protein [Haloactinopolyspora sp.]